VFAAAYGMIGSYGGTLWLMVFGGGAALGLLLLAHRHDRRPAANP
jgi:hypothetical protein